MFPSYFEGLIESILILSLFYLSFVIFFNKEASFRQNRYYLLAGIILSLIMPFIEFSVPQNLTIQYFIQLKAIDIQSTGNQEFGESFSFSIQNILCALYILGVIIFFIRFIFHLIKISRYYKFSRIQKNKSLKLLFTGKKHPVFSFLNFIFIDKESEKSDDLDIIVRHECIHISQKHSVDLLLFELLAIVQWFNPLVWLYRKSIKLNHEYLADKGVLAVGFPIDRYQGVLLQNYSPLVLGLANSFNHSLTFKRLIMMKKNNLKGKSLFKLIVIIPLLVVSVYFISCSEKDGITDNKTVIEEQKSEQVSDSKKVAVESEMSSKEENIGEVYDIAEVMPEYPGGQEALRKFLASELKYPEDAKANGIQGKVYVRFVVSKTGKVINAEIARGVEPSLDEEAIRAVSKIPDFVPASTKGENVSVYYTVPINFSLK